MLRTAIVVCGLAAALSGCAAPGQQNAILDGLAKMEETPPQQQSTQTQCISERRNDGKIVTNCQEDPHAKALRQVSGQ